MKAKILLGLSGLFLIGCSTDETKSGNEAENAGIGNIRLVSFPGNNKSISNNGSMLEFDSWQTFENTANTLDQQVEDYDDAFLAKYGGMSDDDLEIYEERTGYTDQKPLIDFENRYGFTNSLRKRYNAENAIFLNDSILDDSKNPNVTLMFSGGELALVNSRQQVKIGSEIYQANANGYTIVKANYAANLATLDENPSEEQNTQDVNTVSYAAAGAKCTGFKATSIPDFYATHRRVSLVAKIRSFHNYTKTEKMTIHYNRTGGKWKEKRAHMSVSISHTLRNLNCNPNGMVRHKPMNTYKKKKRRDIKITEYVMHRMMVESGVSLSGQHRYNNVQKPYTMAW